MRSIVISFIACAMLTGPAAAEQGDWLVRLRGIIVAPTETSSAVLPTYPGATVSVDNAIVPELDFTYFLTDHIGVEAILATTPHDISGEGSLVGLGEIANTMALPPTLTVQYHFLPSAKVRPYVGVGLNYTIFYSEGATPSLVAAIGATSVHLDDSVNVAFQAGVDIDINERFFLNADIKYIKIDTTGTLTTGALINTVNVDLDPIVAGVGVGMRF